MNSDGILLFIFLNLILIFTVDCAGHDGERPLYRSIRKPRIIPGPRPDSSYYWTYIVKNENKTRTFFINPQYMVFTKGISLNKPTIVNTPYRSNWFEIDYHISNKTLFWISSRVGYFSNNAKIFSMTFDSDEICNEDLSDEDLEKDHLDLDLDDDDDDDDDDDELREENFNDGDPDDEDENDQKEMNLKVDNMGSINLNKTPMCYATTVKKSKFSIIHRYQPLNVKKLREEESWNPRSLAVDYIGNKLYIVDTAVKSVNVLDLNGKNKATVFENESLIPYNIGLDPYRGLMFVLAINVNHGNCQIYRVNMDGTDPKLIVNNTDVVSQIKLHEKTGFIVHTLTEKIYFSNSHNRTIESVSYDGKSRSTVVHANNPLSIAVFNETLYWTNATTNSTFRFLCLKKNCQTYSCSLDLNGICKIDSIKLFIKQNVHPNDRVEFGPSFIKIFHPHLQMNRKTPCQINNGGCQHHCLLKSSVNLDTENNFINSNYGCVCNDGYRLLSDGRNCSPSKVAYAYDQIFLPKLMNYTSLSDNSFQNCSMSRHIMSLMILSSRESIYIQSPFLTFSVSKQRNAIIELRLSPKDLVTKNYDIDSSLFRKRLLKKKYGIPTIFNFIKCYPERNLAPVLTYDWITRNLYFVLRSAEVREEADLMVLKFSRLERTDPNNGIEKWEKDYKNTLNLTRIPVPTYMTVQPYNGFIFASLKNGSVIRINTDGSDKILLPNINDSKLLAIDFNENKLYWSDSDNNVNRVNLNGSEPENLFKLNFTNLIFMYIYDQWIFVKYQNDSIWRANKLNGQQETTLSDFSDYFYDTIGTKVSARDARQVDKEEHPCFYQNGGCEKYCFGVLGDGNILKRVCACDSEYSLSEDGLKCNSSGISMKENDKLKYLDDNDEDDDDDYDGSNEYRHTKKNKLHICDGIKIPRLFYMYFRSDLTLDF